MIKTIITIFLGGGFGASLRFLISYFSANFIKYNFPIATFSINILACFIMGYLYTIFIDKTDISPSIKLALTVGFCGGFSTYTAFSLELLEMLNSARIIQAIIYIVLTLVVGLLALWAGVNFAKLL